METSSDYDTDSDSISCQLEVDNLNVDQSVNFENHHGSEISCDYFPQCIDMNDYQNQTSSSFNSKLSNNNEQQLIK